MAHARNLERGHVPRLPRVRAAVHREATEQGRLRDTQLLAGDGLTLDALELLAQGRFGLLLVGGRRA